MRCWLPILYRDLYHVPASHYSIDPGHWKHVIDCLDDTLHFVEQPTGTGIPLGSKLLAVRHQAVTRKADLHQIYLSERRTWLRLRDPSSIRRTLSADSHRVLHLYADWLQSVSLVKCLRPKQLWSGRCAADAMASSDICQIGGLFIFPQALPFGSARNSLSTILLPWIFQSPKKCKNALHLLKHLRRWRFCTSSAVALLVSDFHYEFLP